METLSLMIHVIAAAVLVGPQVLMFYAVTPATWILADERAKREVVRVIARRFAHLAVGAIVILFASGLYQYYSIVPTGIQDSMMDYRFGELFITKMTLVTVLLVMIVVHGAVLGRRVGRMSDAVIAGTGDAGVLETARAQSLVFSGAMMVISIAILMLGAALGNHEFSYLAR